MTLQRLLLTLLLCVTPYTASAARFDHTIWDGLLREHVFMMNQGQSSLVSYSGFALYHGSLQKYLSQVAQIQSN